MMDSTASDGLPSCPTAPPISALLDDHHHQHQLYLDPGAAATTDAQEPHPPPQPAAAAERRKPRKRARASRRTPTTVFTTDASNFRAMVQEFTGFPAPPFAPHLDPGLLFGGAAGASPSSSGSATGEPPFHQLLRPSPLKLAAATPHAGPPPSCTATSSFAHTFPNPAAVAPLPGLSSELYGARFGSTSFATGAVPCYDEGFTAAMEGERADYGHGLATSFLHAAADRYHNH